jgi:hypothetical protein
VKTGLPHGGSRVEFGQVLFIPLDRNKERSSLDDSPCESTQLDPISDRDRQSNPTPLMLIVATGWCYGCLMCILDGCGLGSEWPGNCS